MLFASKQSSRHIVFQLHKSAIAFIVTYTVTVRFNPYDVWNKNHKYCTLLRSRVSVFSALDIAQRGRNDSHGLFRDWVD